MQRRDGGYNGQRVLKMEMPIRRKRRRPQRRSTKGLCDRKECGEMEADDPLQFQANITQLSAAVVSWLPGVGVHTFA